MHNVMNRAFRPGRVRVNISKYLLPRISPPTRSWTTSTLRQHDSASCTKPTIRDSHARVVGPQVNFLQRHIHVQIPSRILFRSGSSAKFPSAQPSLDHRAHVRSLSYETSPDAVEVKWEHSDKQVRVGGNGSVLLEIYKLRHSGKPTAGEHSVNQRTGHSLNDKTLEEFLAELEALGNSNILLYLSDGLLSDHYSSETTTEFEELLSSFLQVTQQSQSPLVIVNVKYRLQSYSEQDENLKDLRFPTAIHDVSAALDWVVTNKHALLRTNNQDKREAADDASRSIQISLYGDGIGGSLALSLALTQPNLIHSVAAQDPIVDWTALDEIVQQTQSSYEYVGGEDDVRITRLESTSSAVASPDKRRKTRMNSKTVATQIGQHHAARSLINIRTKLFRTPSAFYDPFASPLLFLRAPGRDTPLWNTARPEPEIEEVTNKLVADLQSGLAKRHDFGPYDDDMHIATQYASGNDTTAQPNHGSVSVPTDVKDTSELNDMAEAIGADVSVSTNPCSHPLINHKHDSTTTSLPTPPATPELAKKDKIELDHVDGTTMTTPTLAPTPQPHLVIRRRKVLRRWPSNASPEEVTLPHIRIFTSSPSSSPSFASSSLPPQSTEALSFNESMHTVADALDDSICDIKLFRHVLYSQAKEMVEVMRRACFWGRERGEAEHTVNLEDLNETTTGKGVDGVGDIDGIEMARRKRKRKRIVEWLHSIMKDG